MKKHRDVNQVAHSVVQRATGQAPKTPPPTEPEKTPAQQAAAMLGRLGGLKGGPARAKKLSKKRRVEIAKKAIQARWKGHRKPG